MKTIKNKWKYSSLRFYMLNTIWNYKFWLFAEKIYTSKTRSVDSDEFMEGFDMKLIPKKKIIKSKRFMGYMFEGRLYFDNPGIQGVPEDVWKVWREKRLLNE